MAERPGFMLYFDVAPALARLTDEETGQLFKAVFAYAQYGEVYDLSGICGFAFDLMKPRIDRDRTAYEEQCKRNSYAAYVREAKKHGEMPLEFQKWIIGQSHDIEPHQPTSSDTNRYPTERNVAKQNIAQPEQNVTGTEPEQNDSGSGAGGMGGEPLSDEAFEKRRQQQLAALRQWTNKKE